MTVVARTVLITGGGLVGTHTARLLQERGDRVIVVERAPNREAMASILGAAMPRIVVGSVTDLPLLRATIAEEGVNAIVHTAAALSTAIRAAPPDGIATNILGTTAVLEAARLGGVARVVVASSATVTYAVFDQPADGAYREDFACRILSQRPRSLYAATKLAGEHLALLYADLYRLDPVILRYAAVIGFWRGPDNSVPGRLARTVLQPDAAGRAVIDDPLLGWDGVEDFVDVRDVAAANVAAIDAAQPAQRVYHVATGRTLTFAEFLAAAQAALPGLRIDLRITPRAGFAGFPHARTQPFDVSGAARELGFRAEIALRDTLAELRRWL